MEFKRWISAGPGFLLALLFEIVAVISMLSTARAADNVTYLEASGPSNLEYVVTIDEFTRASGGQLLAAAVGLVVEVPPADFRVSTGSIDRFDFVIDLTTSDRKMVEMTSTLGVAGASSALAYTVFDARTGRYAVRLLWDRIGKMRNARGYLIEHPYALARLVSSIAREVYGNLRILNESRNRKAYGTENADSIRDAYLASAKTLSRIVAHKKFKLLDPRDQRDLKAAASAEFQSAIQWESVAESRRVKANESESNVVRFLSRCEVMFRSPKPSN